MMLLCNCFALVLFMGLTEVAAEEAASAAQEPRTLGDGGEFDIDGDSSDGGSPRNNPPDPETQECGLSRSACRRPEKGPGSKTLSKGRKE